MGGGAKREGRGGKRIEWGVGLNGVLDNYPHLPGLFLLICTSAPFFHFISKPCTEVRQCSGMRIGTKTKETFLAKAWNKPRQK